MKFFGLLAACALSVGQVQAEPLPESAESDIYEYIQNLETLFDGADTLSGGLISAQGFRTTLEGDATFSASWWELFGELLTAYEVLAELEDEDYVGALSTANTFFVKKVISATAFGEGAVQASSVAGVGSLAVELYLEGYVNMMDRRGVERQLGLYREARRLGMTHDEIMERDTSKGVYFSANGWISQISTQETAWVGRPPTNRIKRNEVFELFGAAFDAREKKKALELTVKRRFFEFKEEVKSQSPKVEVNASEWFEPERGTELRRNVLDAIRPRAEEIYGAPVQFMVQSLRVAGDTAFADVDVQQPGGGKIDISVAPGFLSGEVFVEPHGNPFDFQALVKRTGASWFLVRSIVSPSEAWWLDSCADWHNLFPKTCPSTYNFSQSIEPNTTTASSVADQRKQVEQPRAPAQQDSIGITIEERLDEQKTECRNFHRPCLVVTSNRELAKSGVSESVLTLWTFAEISKTTTLGDLVDVLNSAYRKAGLRERWSLAEIIRLSDLEGLADGNLRLHPNQSYFFRAPD